MKVNNVKSLGLIILGELTLYFLSGKSYIALCILFTVIVVIGSLLACILSSSKLKVEIKGGSQGSRNEGVLFTIKVSNESRRPLLNGNLNIEISNAISEEVYYENCSISILPKGTKKIQLRVLSNHSGLVTVAVKKIWIKDMLGIFQRQSAGSGKGNHYVLPELKSVTIVDEDIYKYDMESFKYSETLKGDDTSETFDIRNYQFGDKLKAIHWKLTAKSSELMVKEPSFPIDNNVLLIIDKCMAASPEVKDDAFDAFISLSKALLDKEVAHTVGWYDTSAGGFLTREVRSIMQMWAAVRDALSESFDESRSSIARLIESETAGLFAVYIYVSRDERDLERLRSYGDVNIYRPDNFR